MAEFSKQGTIAVTGTILHTGVERGVLSNISKVMTIRVNNPVAYDFTLTRYNAATATTVQLYDLTLSAGDTLTDNLIYALEAGDELIAYSNVVGTTYCLYGVE
jgi:hypothetical protein